MSFGYQVLGFGASGTAAVSANDNGIFAYGDPLTTNVTNLVSNTGVVATDVTGVGTARDGAMGCEYGGDKGILGYGQAQGPQTEISISNLVSNVGVVSADVTGVGTARTQGAACEYGDDKGIFGFGSAPLGTGLQDVTNLVSNTGVVATDTTGVGTNRYALQSCEYGSDKGIFAYGNGGSYGLLPSNLVSNTGVVAADVTGVGTARLSAAACSFGDGGDDKGIIAYGTEGAGSFGVISLSNIVSNVGVVASDVTGVGTARNGPAACEFGGDKGIFGYGAAVSMTNLVSNTGVVAPSVP